MIYGILSPYISILIRGYGFSHSILGILLALCEGAAIASPFVMGHFADRLGKYRPVLLVSFIMSLCCAVFLFFSRSLLLCALVLPVLAFGYRAVQPLIDAISTINLGKEGYYGKYRTLGSLVFFILVLFFQSTPLFPPNRPQNIAFWVIIMAFLSIMLMLIIPKSYFINKDKTSEPSAEPPPPATAPPRPHERYRKKPVTLKHGAIRKLWSPLFILGFSIIVLNRMAMAPFSGFLSLYVVEELHWDAVGLMWALSSGSEMPFIFLSKRLIKRFNTLPLMAFSTGAVAVRLLICAFFPTPTGIVVAQLLHSFCYGIFHPTAVAFISSCVPPEHRALGMSLYLSLGTGVPTLIGNFAGGFIVEFLGYKALFNFFTIFAILGVLLFFVTRKHTARTL
jgi:PPP family 3-phenylpropionic acid transporter